MKTQLQNTLWQNPNLKPEDVTGTIVQVSGKDFPLAVHCEVVALVQHCDGTRVWLMSPRRTQLVGKQSEEWIDRYGRSVSPLRRAIIREQAGVVAVLIRNGVYRREDSEENWWIGNQLQHECGKWDDVPTKLVSALLEYPHHLQGTLTKALERAVSAHDRKDNLVVIGLLQAAGAKMNIDRHYIDIAFESRGQYNHEMKKRRRKLLAAFLRSGIEVDVKTGELESVLGEFPEK